VPRSLRDDEAGVEQEQFVRIAEIDMRQSFDELSHAQP
jgi:hypothetical protein